MAEPASATSSVDPANTYIAFNDLLLPEDAKKQFEKELKNLYKDIQWDKLAREGEDVYNLALGRLLVELGPLFWNGLEAVPQYEVWLLHRHYALEQGEALVSYHDEKGMIERPSNLATEKSAHLVEDTWDRHGQPLRYSIDDLTISPPSKEFWAKFKGLTVDKGITMLGVSVAPSRIDLEKSDLEKSLEKSPIETKEKGRVLMQRPKPGSDRERVATYEPYDAKAFGCGWLWPMMNSKPDNISRSDLNPSRSENSNSINGHGWLSYTANALVGKSGVTSDFEDSTATGTTQNCVNQCGPG